MSNDPTAVTLLDHQTVYADGESDPADGFDTAKSIDVHVVATGVVRYTTDPEDRTTQVLGNETVTVIVQHKDDDGDWGDAYSQEFEADGSATLSVQSPKNNVRVAWTLGGANPQPTLSATVTATPKTFGDVALPVETAAEAYLNMTLDPDGDLSLPSLEKRSEFPVDGADVTGQFAEVVTSWPVEIDEGDAVVLPGSLYLSGLPPADGEFILKFKLFVANMDGTQLLKVVASVTLDPNTPTATLDLNDATVTAVAGEDLSWAGGQVVSAAGGVFVVTALISGSFD